MRLISRTWLVLAAAVCFCAGTVRAESEQAVDCPKCHGKGIALEIECPSCIHSPKPGYNNMGERLEMCQRCKGTAKIIGAYCSMCTKGKVYLSQFKPCDGGTKPPPSGWLWCPKCMGSGVESWIPCNQCKRSKWPGYTQMGEGLMLCNRCNGKGQLPGLACTTCEGKGTVVDKTPKEHK